jgi:hypothetical protein
MMKYRVVCLFITVAALVALATAQNTQARSSSAKSGPDPLQTATKPLTPKSAITPHRKSSVALPATNDRNTTAELTRMERQNVKAGDSKSVSVPSAQRVSPVKSADTSAGNGSGINFKYKKPAGGLRASTPDAQSANSGRPVTKKN